MVQRRSGVIPHRVRQCYVRIMVSVVLQCWYAAGFRFFNNNFHRNASCPVCCPSAGKRFFTLTRTRIMEETAPPSPLWKRSELHACFSCYTQAVDLANIVNKNVRELFSSMFVVSNSSISNSGFQALLKEWEVAKSGTSTSFQNLCFPMVRQC